MLLVAAKLGTIHVFRFHNLHQKTVGPCGQTGPAKWWHQTPVACRMGGIDNDGQGADLTNRLDDIEIQN